MLIHRLTICAAILVAAGAPAHAAVPPAPAAQRPACAHDPSWTAPQKPFRIYGNTWHVGPRGLGVFLIASPAGHVLIDGGVPAKAGLIEANIRRLGFKLRDVKWILNSHAHCDHAGGIAQLARDTGAEVIANAADAALLSRGGRGDPRFGDKLPFPPVRVARTVTDGERLQLGEIVMTAHTTAGHTKGNTTWTWQSCAWGRCLAIALVGSLSAPGYKLIGDPAYPGIVDDFEAGFATVAAVPCDIALAPHPGMVDFWERVARRDRGNPDALIDPSLCAAYAKEARRDFLDELARQRTAAAPGTKQRR